MAHDLRPFNTEALTHIHDGRVAARVDKLIADAQRDISEAPHVDKLRTVTVKVTLDPDFDRESRTLNGVSVRVTSSLKLPERKSGKVYALSDRGGLMYNPEHCEDYRQSTLFQVDKEDPDDEDDEETEDEVANA